MAALTKAQMLTALDVLMKDGAQIRQQFLKDFTTWTPLFVAWSKACESTLEAIYGTGAEALQSFKGIYFLPPPTEKFVDAAQQAAGELVWYDSGLAYALMTLAGYRYSIDKLLPPDLPKPRSPYNVLVSHGGATMAHVDAVTDLLESIGLSPVVIARRPSLNLSVNQKVLMYLNACSAGIALATAEDETIAAETRTRPNVEHEIGLMQAAPNIGGRIVYCKEPDVKFASNYAEKVWIPFEKDRVQDAFVPILRELRAFGLI